MSSREPTLADVAQLAGVSLTTVSRVLNNRGYLSEKTKRRVADAIEALGYRPNSLARALHGMRTQTVGLIVPTVSLPFFGELAVEVENALAEAGYRILICNSMGRAEREREYLSLLVGNRVDGIISGAHNEGLQEYDTIRMPLVTIDRDLSPSIPNVRCANEEAGAAATRALLEAGSRHPVLLTSRSGPHNLREAGYRAEVEGAGLHARVLTVPFDTPTPQRFTMVRDALDEAHALEPVDGVFATDDLAGAEVLEWARTRELSVPGDLSVIGFDGTETMRRALPHLATIRQPIEEIARAAVSILLGQIDGTLPRIPSDEAGAGVARTVEFAGTLLRGRSLAL
ncbi:LacI family DNA-binding transcriptional regulator [Cellulomonas flavigena]|uniref:LacI family DNA-binding transcriptional regulator n=1 Tax=Cellulomonas flavigena TaxID=1711 RepID=UPI000660ABE8|nr:LacI family DNA-binding transcriptional regulator [Cellulomonas flavigena]